MAFLHLHPVPWDKVNKRHKSVSGLLFFAVELLFVDILCFFENMGFRAGMQASPSSSSGNESGIRSLMATFCSVLGFP